MTKTKVSKVWHKTAEHFQEHQYWNFPAGYPGRPGERGLPAAFDAVVASIRSICGGIDDSQPVELYDGALGVSRSFVRQHERPVGQLQWRSDLDRLFPDPGDVAGKRWATGTLIGRNLFLTVAHAFEQPEDRWRLPRQPRSDQPIRPEDAARGMQVNFDYQEAPGGRLRREQSYPVLELMEYRLGGLDVAIIRLGGNPGDTYGFAALATEDARERDLLCLIQHPEGQPKRLDAGPLFHSHGDLIGYDAIDTLGGSSGAGILRVSSGLLVGVHTHGGCDDRAIGHNHGVKMSAVIRESALLKELLRTAWRQQNLTEAAGAPQLKSDPAAAGPHILYRGHHGSLQQVRLRDGRWRSANLTAGADLPKMRGTPSLLATGEGAFGFFRGRDRHVHLVELDEAVRYLDLTETADLPPAAGDPVARSTRDGLSVAYLGNDGHLHEVRRRNGRWGRAGSPSRATGAPEARGDGLQGVAMPEAYYWVYYDRAGDLQLLRWDRQWRRRELGGGDIPKAKGRPALWVTPGTEQLQLLYPARRGELVLLREADGWRPVNLTEQNGLPRAQDEPVVFSVGGEVHLLYCDRDDHLQWLRPEGDRWRHTRITAEAGLPVAKGRPAVYEIGGALHFLLRTRDRQLYDLWKE